MPSSDRGRAVPREPGARGPESAPTIPNAQRRMVSMADAGWATVKGDASSDGSLASPDTASPRGRYVMRGELGRGGMGVVSSVFDIAIRREVAMKAALREADDPSDRARFIYEAQVTGQLEHPNIVPVHELGFGEDGQPYFTMKLVRGRTLAERLVELRTSQLGSGRGGVFPLTERLEIFVKVCDALGYAHAHGVIHRDLKPANIMLGPFGEVMVMDWGLAREIGTDVPAPGADHSARPERAGGLGPLAPMPMADRAQLTAAGAIVGTPAYMSPEQALGEGQMLDARCDIFSLGAVLYELLTLTPPYQGHTQIEILEQACEGQIQPVRERVAMRASGHPRIPRELSGIAHRALARNREDRYPDAGALVADIRAWQSFEPGSAWRDGMLARAVKWVRARPGSAFGSALALTGALSVALLAQQLQVSRRDTELAEARAAQARDAAVRETLEAEQAKLRELAALGRVDDLEAALGGVARRDAATVRSELVKQLKAWRGGGRSYEAFAASLRPGSAEEGLRAFDRMVDGERLGVVKPTADDWFARGLLRQLLQGNLYGAIDDYSRALALDPGQPGTYVNRGFAHQGTGDFDRALADYGRALELDPTVADVYFNRGVLRLKRGQPEAAEADFDTAIQMAPGRTDFLVARAVLRRERGNVNGAAQDAARALELQPGLPEALVQRGWARLNLGDRDGAESDARSAIGEDRSLGMAWLLLGRVLYEGDHVAALAALDAAIERLPNNTFALAYRAQVHLLLGGDHVSVALRDAQRLVALDPESASGWSLCGAAHLALSQRDEAVAAFDHLLARRPSDWATWENRATAIGAADRVAYLQSLQEAWRHCPEAQSEDREALAVKIRSAGGIPGK